MNYEFINKDSPSRLLISVEHASSDWPKAEKIYGIEEDWQVKHYAYDLGARDFSLMLAGIFKCPTILGSFSRVLVDLNRIPGDPDIIANKSIDNDELPMNKILSNKECDQRILNYYVPYHTALRKKLFEGITHHISIHSYASKTASQGDNRSLELGIQYPVRNKMVESALKYFKAIKGESVGDNKPYNLREVSPGAISLHSAPFGIETVELEFRNDQLTDQINRDFWLKNVSEWITNDVLINPS